MDRNRYSIKKFLSTAKKCTYKQTESENLAVYVHLPKNATGKLPVVINLHGGGWAVNEYTTEHDYAMWGGTATRLNNAGIAFVNVQYRVCSEKSRHPDLVYDCMDAAAWVASDPEKIGFDSDRIAVMGESAGGHLSLLTALGSSGYPDPERAPYRISAVVDMSGPTDLCSSDYMRNPVASMFGENVFGKSYEQLPDQYKRFSPIYYMDSVKNPPALAIIHGDSDIVVPADQSIRLYEEAKKRGWDVRLYMFKNAGHGFVPINGKRVIPNSSEVVTIAEKFLIGQLTR
ncbi:MAG: alpha/beta fold hydrolase [Saccharofermentanales bacterium]